MPDRTPPATPSALWGGLRWVQARRVSGWAFAPKRPDEHLHVEVWLDGALVGTARAAQFFEQLAKANICPGDHGFTIETDVALPVDAPERIEVVAVATTGERLRLQLPDAGETADRGAGGATRVVRFAASDPQQHPVFVIGANRSGTSVMGRGLRKTGRFAGHGEGHLIALLPQLIAVTQAHYQREESAAQAGQFTMLASVPARVVEDGLAALFVKVARAQFPGGAWMDKTPGAEMIRAAPALLRVWPNARFVFMQRRGIENVDSRRRKWPERSFEAQCQAWADAMLAWEEVRDELAAVSAAIDQLDLVARPERVAETVGALLELTDDEAARLLQTLRTERPQQTAAQLGAVADPAELGWDEGERAAFLAICGGAMERFGYTMDRRYRRV